MNRVIFFFLMIVLVQCVPGSTRPTLPPECRSMCEGKDVSLFDIENVDDYIVFVKYGYSSSGETPPAAFKTSRVDGNSEHPYGIPFDNVRYNHFYFYSDVAMNDLIGVLIIRNTQPTNAMICKARVQYTGNFSAQENRILVTNSIGTASIRHSQLPISHLVVLGPGDPQHNFSGLCGRTRFNTAPSNYFHHLYFYSKEGVSAHESNIMSKIVYRNTRSEKINLYNITIQ